MNDVPYGKMLFWTDGKRFVTVDMVVGGIFGDYYVAECWQRALDEYHGLSLVDKESYIHAPFAAARPCQHARGTLQLIPWACLTDIAHALGWTKDITNHVHVEKAIEAIRKMVALESEGTP